MNKPPAMTVMKWLRLNLGSRALAPLTSTDVRALLASVSIAELWNHSDGDRELLTAWGACVRQMQPSTRELALHAVAHVAEWQTRFVFWQASGLPPLTRITRCAGEPRPVTL